MSAPLIAVTGSTGRVGGIVAATLAEAGISQRLIVRDPARATALPRTEVAVASYGDQPASIAALSGVDTLFMVSAAEAVDRRSQHLAFVDAAAEAGVRHIVYLSFYGAAADSVFTLGRDHWATEEHIRESGMAWTFVRDNFYLDYMALFAGEEGVIRGPAGDGRLAPIAQADAAAVVAALLPEADRHAGQTLSLTGPVALTLTEIASQLTEALGRPVRYQAETVEEAYESRAPYGAADWQVDAWVSTYTSIAAGEVDGVTDDVERILGRPPIGIAELYA